MGNVWLARGTKLDSSDPQSHNDRGRILPGKNIDLGRDAASLYTEARSNLDKAATQTPGESSDAGRIAAERALVDKQLSQIYGGHNIDAVYQELLAGLNGQKDSKESFSINHLANFEMRLKAKDKYAGEHDPAGYETTVRAKLSRDVALVDLALAAVHGTRGDRIDAKTYYQSAVKYLGTAQSLDPNSTDGKQLQRIANQRKKYD